MKLLIASSNKGKLKEIKNILSDFDIEILSLDDISYQEDVEESAMTFEGNAIIKAMTMGEESGLLTLADDSGLEVDVLNGDPGVKSARWVSGTDQERYEALLLKLKDVPDEKRGANFRTVIAIYNPKNKKIRTCEGIFKGKILREAKGENGFAYDPIFYSHEAKKTNAEMSLEEKNSISHRAKALEKAKQILKEDFIDNN